jgi:hypothetical protein
MLQLRINPRYGASWEGFALEQTLAVHGQRDAYFYGTQRAAELNLLLLRRGKRWGFEFKCTDAPRTTKSMHVALDDLQLEHLWVVYPGTLRYALSDKITALPLREIASVRLRRSGTLLLTAFAWLFCLMRSGSLSNRHGQQALSCSEQ